MTTKNDRYQPARLKVQRRYAGDKQVSEAMLDIIARDIRDKATIRTVEKTSATK
jgi:hypothetical protein